VEKFLQLYYIKDMVKTVNEAFNIFLNDYVNLDMVETQRARTSRDWLLAQIHLFPDRDINFPKLYSEKDISFGSFSRRTKKRPLDDIDMMIALSAEGGVYHEVMNTIEIYIPDSAHELKNICFDNTNILSSRKVINKFISLLEKVPQYKQADIKRNMEAATLNLKTYPWTFDIVPCFFTQKDWLNRDYYLIPDGQGNWKKTDPRIDRNRVTDINQYHDGNVLNVIRLMKYWNKRPTMPSMSSYLLENIILNFYSAQQYTKASGYIEYEFIKVLRNIQYSVFHPVNDPKKIQGNINQLSMEERYKISERASLDYRRALEARDLVEKQSNHKLAIRKWSEIFGDNFPSYI
jgi:hypothetical protein